MLNCLAVEVISGLCFHLLFPKCFLYPSGENFPERGKPSECVRFYIMPDHLHPFNPRRGELSHSVWKWQPLPGGAQAKGAWLFNVVQ